MSARHADDFPHCRRQPEGKLGCNVNYAVSLASAMGYQDMTPLAGSPLPRCQKPVFLRSAHAVAIASISSIHRDSSVCAAWKTVTQTISVVAKFQARAHAAERVRGIDPAPAWERGPPPLDRHPKCPARGRDHPKAKPERRQALLRRPRSGLIEPGPALDQGSATLSADGFRSQTAAFGRPIKSLLRGNVTCYTSYTMVRELEFCAGSPALDLIDTISGRGGVEVDLLSAPAALGQWLARAGIVTTAAVQPDDSHLRSACACRDAMFRCVRAALAGVALPQADIDLINDAARGPAFHPQLIDGKIVMVATDPLDAALAVLAADAIMLLTPPRRERLRTCPGCQMVFIDNSRPGRRRWCSSASGCGNRAKVRHFRKRQEARQQGSVDGG
jgi:predicted RNA-binding Zn ribbon-like protein